MNNSLLINLIIEFGIIACDSSGYIPLDLWQCGHCLGHSRLYYGPVALGSFLLGDPAHWILKQLVYYLWVPAMRVIDVFRQEDSVLQDRSRHSHTLACQVGL